LKIVPARGTSGVRHLFESWRGISRRVRDAKEIRVYLDFDGTLVNYQAHPEGVKLSREAKRALGKLARRRNVHVAIVSGRRRGVLVRHVKVPRVHFMGLYGWESGKSLRLPVRTIQKIRRLRRTLASLPSELPGISIEEKGMSVAVHFRGASAEMQRRAQKCVRKALGRTNEDLHVLRSNDVWDVLPKQVRGKGDALRKALRGAGRGMLPIFVGDDVTDESAFVALSKGITVLAGPQRKTRAQFGLRNPEEVCRFLEKLEAELSLGEKKN